MDKHENLYIFHEDNLEMVFVSLSSLKTWNSIISPVRQILPFLLFVGYIEMNILKCINRNFSSQPIGEEKFQT